MSSYLLSERYINFFEYITTSNKIFYVIDIYTFLNQEMSLDDIKLYGSNQSNKSSLLALSTIPPHNIHQGYAMPE